MRNVKGIAVTLAPVAVEMRLISKSQSSDSDAVFEHGVHAPIFVRDDTGEVIGGRARLAALRMLGVQVTENMIRRI